VVDDTIDSCGFYWSSLEQAGSQAAIGCGG